MDFRSLKYSSRPLGVPLKIPQHTEWLNMLNVLRNSSIYCSLAPLATYPSVIYIYEPRLVFCIMYWGNIAWIPGCQSTSDDLSQSLVWLCCLWKSVIHLSAHINTRTSDLISVNKHHSSTIYQIIIQLSSSSSKFQCSSFIKLTIFTVRLKQGDCTQRCNWMEWNVKYQF